MPSNSKPGRVYGLLAMLAVALASGGLFAQPEVDFERQTFSVVEGNSAEARAFVIEPPDSARLDGSMPWVWYAPTLGRYPAKEEQWMFERFQAAGIAIAGVDVGESYGNPAGRKVYQALYETLTSKRNYSKKPVLLARSRGGLMLYNWACEHPESVGAIAGIYPVCNLASYPGLQRAAGAYDMSESELQASLNEHNPIARLRPLAKMQVPIFHIHGDQDKIVPLDENSAELARRYKALGGPVTVEIVKGQGHNMWAGWFQSERLTRFVIEHAKQ